MTKDIPFFKFTPAIGTADRVADVINSGWLTTGRVTKSFEQGLKDVLSLSERNDVLCVNSATSALHLALLCLGVGKGDEVIVPSLTFNSSASVVHHVGATVRFCDVRPDTLSLDPNHIKGLLNKKTAAIMLVHFGGYYASVSKIRDICGPDIRIISDCAHLDIRSWKSLERDREMADLSIFSFYANKTLTSGEGGCIVTDVEKIARLRPLSSHGMDKAVYDRFTNVNVAPQYDISQLGYKYNMPDVLAAIGISGLSQVEYHSGRRRDIANRYIRELGPMGFQTYSDVDSLLPHSRHIFPVLVPAKFAPRRDAIISELQTLGVGVSIHYKPLHLHSYWKPFVDCDSEGMFKVTEDYYARAISLPCYPALSDQDQSYVIAALESVLSI